MSDDGKKNLICFALLLCAVLFLLWICHSGSNDDRSAVGGVESGIHEAGIAVDESTAGIDRATEQLESARNDVAGATESVTRLGEQLDESTARIDRLKDVIRDGKESSERVGSIIADVDKRNSRGEKQSETGGT